MWQEIKSQINSIDDSFKKSVNELNQKYNTLSEKLETINRNKQLFQGITNTSDLANFSKFMRERSGNKQEIITRTTMGNTATDAQGGYAVPFVLDSEIIKKSADLNIMRSICQTITVSSPETAWNVDIGGADSGWVGEVDPRPQTNAPQLGQRTISWGELYAMPIASQVLLDDAAFNVEDWYTNTVAEVFAEKEEEAFLVGDGSKKPKGLLTYTLDTADDYTRANDSIQKVEGAISFDSIISLYYSLRQVYKTQGQCSFLMNPATIEQLRKLKDAQDNYIWVNSIDNSMAGSLLGCPVYESRFMPTPDSGANAILFGNFNRAYKIVDRLGLRVIRDPYSNKGQVSFYTSKRVGSVLGDACAVKVLTLPGE